MKYVIGALMSLILVGVIFYYFFYTSKQVPVPEPTQNIASPAGSEPTTFANSGIPCIKASEAGNLKTHVHTLLKPFVDGEELVVPDIIGRSKDCTAEIHTEDLSGMIHVESPRENIAYTMTDLFSVLNEPLEKNGYTLVALVNGATSTDIANYVFKNNDQVQLRYTKNKTSAALPKKP